MPLQKSGRPSSRAPDFSPRRLGATGTLPGAVRWNLHGADQTISTGQVYNTPVFAEGRIAFSDSKGVVHVLDLEGRLVWSTPVTEFASNGQEVAALLDAPLAVFQNVLIAGSATGVVHAWNIGDGTRLWKTDTDKPVLGTPTFATVSVDGTPRASLYLVDQGEGALQCLDFSTGKHLWSGDAIDRCDGSPAANDKFVVYGSCASAVHVFSPLDGKLLREIPVSEDSQVAGGVVLLDELVFTGSRSGLFVHANAATGETIWTNSDCDGEALFTPAVDAEHVVFSADDTLLYCLNRKDGALLWKTEFDDTPSSAVIARDKAVIGADGALHLVSMDTGAVLWSYPVADEITSPGIAGGLVVVGGDDGSVTAFGAKRGT